MQNHPKPLHLSSVLERPHPGHVFQRTPPATKQCRDLEPPKTLPSPSSSSRRYYLELTRDEHPKVYIGTRSYCTRLLAEVTSNQKLRTEQEFSCFLRLATPPGPGDSSPRSGSGAERQRLPRLVSGGMAGAGAGRLESTVESRVRRRSQWGRRSQRLVATSRNTGEQDAEVEVSALSEAKSELPGKMGEPDEDV